MVLGSGSPKLLLVSHDNNAAEIIRALLEQGLPEPIVGSGGDDTLDVYDEASPDVVIMVAGLAVGDVPSLAAAMRSGHYGRPAPILLIVGETESIASVEASKNSDFHRVLRKPILAPDLATAVLECGEKATGARMNAAMDMAIESLVLDAMDSLNGELHGAEASNEGQQVATQEQEGVEPESPLSSQVEATALLHPTREPTAVLGELDAGASPLSAASQALLDQVLPGETLHLDLDELDAVERIGPKDDTAQSNSDGSLQPEPPGGGDFARKLRMKMSAMAERLFPGQGEEEPSAAIAPLHAAHTEIDLGAIADAGVPVDADEEYSSGSSTGHEDSDITMPRQTGHGSSSSAQTRHMASGSVDRQALVGTLDSSEHDIAAVLARLWQREFSGCLVLVRDEEEKRVHFDNGRVVFASSTGAADRMGELLLRQGMINNEQLRECREQVRSSGRRFGEELVDLGYLKPRELLPAVRQHLEDIIYSVFSWTHGSYDALPEQTIDERIRLSSHPAALIVEGIRRKYDRLRLESCLGGMGQVLITATGDKQLSTIAAADLSGPESEAQRLFDGEHTLDDAGAESQLQGLRVAQLAYAWICLGVAEAVDNSSEPRVNRSSSAGYLVGETDLAIDRQRVRAKYLLVQDADYFQLLGVRQDASGFEIRRAYESAQRHFSVESFPPSLQEELQSQLEEISAVIEEAYLVLSDDRIRGEYRANLR
ncbi:MAG: DUF4388 domain-containing protein [Myxococcales bacterium]|nr:DUF4388 domain-containing protein [Myxococcales bacterium]